MPLVFSYGWERNPPRLLKRLGLGPKIGSSREEERFYTCLDRAPNEVLAGLCLIMGGFMDGILGRAFAVAGLLPPFICRSYDVYYREHDEDQAARRLVLRYGRIGRPIIVIGHSWGASTAALDVLSAPFVRRVPVRALLTLDPVGVRKPEALPSVRRWRNVYVDYDMADWSRQNNVARLGVPWGKVTQADENLVFPASCHSDAAGMFKMFGVEFLETLHGHRL